MVYLTINPYRPMARQLGPMGNSTSAPRIDATEPANVALSCTPYVHPSLSTNERNLLEKKTDCIKYSCLSWRSGTSWKKLRYILWPATTSHNTRPKLTSSRPYSRSEDRPLLPRKPYSWRTTLLTPLTIKITRIKAKHRRETLAPLNKPWQPTCPYTEDSLYRKRTAPPERTPSQAP